MSAGVFQMDLRASLPKSQWPYSHRVELTTSDGHTLAASCELIEASGRVAFRLTLGDEEEPAVRREFGATFGEFDFVLLARDGELRFRAVNVASGMPLFEERAAVENLGPAAFARFRLGVGSAQSPAVSVAHIALRGETATQSSPGSQRKQ